MAVCTPDIAFIDLSQKASPRYFDCFAYVELLLIAVSVIEVEHHDVGFSTVDAGMLIEIVVNVFTLCLFCALAFCRVLLRI
jgi:hypothetical protein